MAKRFSDSTLWDQDWFLDLRNEYQLFVLFLRDNCDHAGIWTPNARKFEYTSKVRINMAEFLQSVNTTKIRVLVLENGRWWITGFCEDQYHGLVLSTSNSVHKGVVFQFENNQVPYLSYGYKIDPTKGLRGPKDKDKDKDKDIVLSSPLGEEGFKEACKTKTWKNNFELYQTECKAAFDDAKTDKDWQKWQLDYYPPIGKRRLNMFKTLDKMYCLFWGTEAGWKHKKKSKTDKIDWQATIQNGIGMKSNQVWEDSK